MTTITLFTQIAAPIHEVFDLARDIDFHQQTASQTQEKAIAGVTTGFIGLEETVTWKGKHFGFWLTHKSIISELQSPAYFVDEMMEGRFKNFRHEHYFKSQKGATIMKDHLSYEVPYGMIGSILDRLFIKKHFVKFLKTRNKHLKMHLEEV